MSFFTIKLKSKFLLLSFIICNTLAYSQLVQLRPFTPKNVVLDYIVWSVESIDNIDTPEQYQKALILATDSGWTLPSASIQATQKRFLNGLKSIGAMARIAHISTVVDGAEFSRINLKAPGRNFVDYINTNFTPGVEMQGTGASNSYINSHFNPTTDSSGLFQYNNSSIAVYTTRDLPDGNTSIFGSVGNSSARVILKFKNSGKTEFVMNGTSTIYLDGTSAVSHGFSLLDKLGDSIRLFQNGLELATGTRSQEFIPNEDFYFLAVNNGGNRLLNSGNGISVILIGASVADIQYELYQVVQRYIDEMAAIGFEYQGDPSAIAQANMVIPDPSVYNIGTEFWENYTVTPLSDPPQRDNMVIHTVNDAADTSDYLFENGRLVGIDGEAIHYHEANNGTYNAWWKDFEWLYFWNKPTRIDTFVLAELTGLSIDTTEDCNTWLRLWGSNDGYNKTVILDSVTSTSSGSLKGYVLKDTNHYNYLIIQPITSDPNLQLSGCGFPEGKYKWAVSGHQKGDSLLHWLHSDDIPNGVEKKIPFNAFTMQNSFLQAPREIQSVFPGGARVYVGYNDLWEKPGDKLFIDPSLAFSYFPHWNGDDTSGIIPAGADGLAIRYLKNHTSEAVEQMRLFNPKAELMYTVQQSSNAYLSSKSTSWGGYHYLKGSGANEKIWSSGTTYRVTDPDFYDKVKLYPTAFVNEGLVERDTSTWDFSNFVYEAWDSAYGLPKDRMSALLFFRKRNDESRTVFDYRNMWRIDPEKMYFIANPVTRDSILEDPRTYSHTALLWYNHAALGGKRKVPQEYLWLQSSNDTVTGRNFLTYGEIGNEDNQDWTGFPRHKTMEVQAAEFSAALDGHCGIIPNPSGSPCNGALGADPDFNLTMAASTQGNHKDMIRFANALYGLRKPLVDSLNAAGIYTYPCNGDTIRVMPDTLWFNYHHYLSSTGGQGNRQNEISPGNPTKRAITAKELRLYEELKHAMASVKSFEKRWGTHCEFLLTETDVMIYSGASLSVHRSVIGQYNYSRQNLVDSSLNYALQTMEDELFLRGDSFYFTGSQFEYYRNDTLTQTLPVEEVYTGSTWKYADSAFSYIYVDADSARNFWKRYGYWDMVPGYGLHEAATSWDIAARMDMMAAGLHRVVAYWQANWGGAYYTPSKWDSIQSRDSLIGYLRPDHEAKWIEGDVAGNTFTDAGYFGNPSLPFPTADTLHYDGYMWKTKAYTWNNLLKLLGSATMESYGYYSEGDTIAYYNFYNEQKNKHYQCVFIGVSKYKELDISLNLPGTATNIKSFDIVGDTHHPPVEYLGSPAAVLTVSNRPLIIEYEIP